MLSARVYHNTWKQPVLAITLARQPAIVSRLKTIFLCKGLSQSMETLTSGTYISKRSNDFVPFACKFSLIGFIAVDKTLTSGNRIYIDSQQLCHVCLHFSYVGKHDRISGSFTIAISTSKCLHQLW